MKKIVISLIFCVSMIANMVAQNIIADGIVYDLDSVEVSATVAYNELEQYSGIIAIPDSVFHDGIWYKVAGIGEIAFAFCLDLIEVTVPEGVTSIGSSAFNSCMFMTDISLPESVESIGDHAFFYCTSLTDMVIPGNVSVISDYSFNGCSALTRITIPESVKVIGDNAFDAGTPLSRDIYCYADTVPSATDTSFGDSFEGILHVPASSLENYSTTSPWMYFDSIVALTSHEEDIHTDILQNRIESSRYYIGLDGIRSSIPFNGINLVVTKFKDGTVTVTKSFY